MTEMFMLGGGQPPQRIKTADIEICDTGQSWRITVNGRHLKAYPHRITFAEADTDARHAGESRLYGLPVYKMPVNPRKKPYSARIVTGMNLGDEVARAIDEDLRLMKSFADEYKLFTDPMVKKIVGEFFTERESLLARMKSNGYQFEE